MIAIPSVWRPRKARLVAHAYFDDSNSFGKTGFICFCGYVSDDPGWESFDREWKALLKNHDLPRLHTSDFLNVGGEYKSLQDTVPYTRRVEIIQQFIAVIQNRILCGISVGLDSAAFKEIFLAERNKPKPELFCFYRAVRLTIQRSLIPGWQGAFPMIMVFDDAHEHSMRFYRAYREIRSRSSHARASFAGICFADDRFVPALQAADLLACATVREYKRGADAWDEDSPFRGLLEAKNPVYGLLYDQEYWSADDIQKNRSEIIKMGEQN
jgi:hypothetical protein